MSFPTRLFGALFILSALSWSAEIAGPRRHAPMIVHERHGGNVGSTNWSGYAVTGPSGSVSKAKGSWVVPAVQGSCTSTNQYSSFWVGIDGFSSGTVEQIGTDSDCQNGAPVYYAWFEFYPHPSFLVNSVPIHPGDLISASVNYANGRFTVSLMDETTGQSFSTSTKMNSAQRSSAEWIAEAPASSGGILPLADFGLIDFGIDYTGVTSTCDATVSNVTGSIGSFSASSVYQITMVTGGTSSTIKAQPSALTSAGTGFTDTWFHN